MHLKISPAKRRPFCPGEDELKQLLHAMVNLSIVVLVLWLQMRPWYDMELCLLTLYKPASKCIISQASQGHQLCWCHIPECSIQNRNVHISVLNGTFWDMKQVHFGISENGLLLVVTVWAPTLSQDSIYFNEGWWYIYFVIELYHPWLRLGQLLQCWWSLMYHYQSVSMIFS